MSISASMVKELRERSGAGMMDCQKALKESNGDIEGAINWLRTKGLSAAAKKSGRTAAEGLVGVYAQGNRGAICEINSETDFVARNDAFKKYVSDVAQLALESNGDIEKLKGMAYPDTTHTVEQELTSLIATIGENMHLRRTHMLEVPAGLVASYVHNKTDEGLGRIGVLVALSSEASADVLKPLAHQLSMHIAATEPKTLSVSELDPDLIANERKIFTEQADSSGKPEAVLQQMIEGRLKKFYKEVVLLEQSFIMDPNRSVMQVLDDASTAAGKPIQVSGFVRFALGEGIEKVKEDFASEVAAQLSK